MPIPFPIPLSGPGVNPYISPVLTTTTPPLRTLQTYVNSDTPYFAPFTGGGGSVVSSFIDASISSLTVSSINGVPPEQLDVADWATFPAVSSFSMQNNSITDVSTITAQHIIVETLTALSTIHAISSISTTTESVQEIVNLSSINGSNVTDFSPASWSLYASQSTVQMAGFDIQNVNDVYASALWATNASTNTQIYNANVGENFAFLTQRSFNLSGDTQTFFTTGGPINGFGLLHLQNNSTIGQILIRNGGILFSDANYGQDYLMSNGFWTSSINCSSINGAEFTTSGVIVSTLATTSISSINGTFSNLATNGFSTIGASIQAGLMSSIQFNPSLGGINIDMGLGQFGGALLGTLGAGIFGALVAVPVTAGTITYGLTKGLASLFEPRPINNIDNNVFETYNYQTQLQVSTLNEQISTIYRFISTIPSTIQINADPINSTISQTNVEVFISTISPPAPVTCIRSIGDPLQTASTPWTYLQSFGQWTPIPEAGLNSNVSTLTLSTLTLAPSTILRSLDLPGGVLEVLENPDTGAYGQVTAQGYTMKDAVGATSNGTFIYSSGTDRPLFIDNGAVSHTLAYTTDIPAPSMNPVVSTLTAQFDVISGGISTGAVACQTIGATGQIVSYNSVSASGSNALDAFAQLAYNFDAPGDALFYGVTSTANAWGKFYVRPDATGVDIINAVGGFQECLLNVGSNGGINLFDANSNLAYFSANTLYASNASLDTVVSQVVSTQTLHTSSINGQVFPIAYASFFSLSTIGNTGVNVVMPTGCEVAQYDVYGNFSNTNSTIIMPYTGTYEINTSIQFACDSSSPENVYFWLQKNGINIPNSASIVGLTKDGNTLGNLSIIEQFSAGDEVAVVWESTETTVSTIHIAGTGNHPDVPSHIISVKQIGL